MLYKVPVGDLDTPKYPERSPRPCLATGLFTSYLALRRFQNPLFNLPNHVPLEDLNSIEGLQATHLRRLSLDYEITASEVHALFSREPREYGRFCTTRRGYIGVVRPLAELGDLICIFSGFTVPLCSERAARREHIV